MDKSPAVTNGHLPTLIASFLHFDLSFMLWVLLGSLGIFISESVGLSAGEKGLMVAVPILTGSLLRVPLGLLGDRVGAKRVGVGMLLFLYLPLTLGWLSGDRLATLFGIGLLLGTAGASFAVALPLASRWYPQERQGLVLGIAAAGNSGTVIANLAAPHLAGAMGWHNVLAVAMVPLTLVLIAFLVMAKDSPNTAAGQPIGNYALALKRMDLWWFCLFYSITFGGYVGLSSFMPIFFRDQYGVSPVTAGYLTGMIAFVGSAVRPAGGYIADRFGGASVLSVLLTGISLFYLLVSQLPPLWMFVGAAAIGMACLGMGNGAVFQLVPQRFPSQIGVATGVVGALGGLGGFFVPILLGNMKANYGSFASGFLILAFIAIGTLILLRILALIWDGRKFSLGGRSDMNGSISAGAPRIQMAPYLQP